MGHNRGKVTGHMRIEGQSDRAFLRVLPRRPVKTARVGMYDTLKFQSFHSLCLLDERI